VYASNGAETTIIDGDDLQGSTVGFSNGETRDSILRGFTIINGRIGNPFPEAPSVLVGGAIFISEASPLIEDCTIASSRSDFGGGLYAQASNAMLDRCQFISNESMLDGAAVLSIDSTMMFLECEFDSNLAGRSGGAMHILEGGTALEACVFRSNVAVEHGGAISLVLQDSSDTVTLIDGAEILENEAFAGGGIFVVGDGSRLHLQSVAFCDNLPGNIDADDWVNDGENSDCVCPGDFDEDGQVGGSDLTVLLAGWGDGDPLADLNEDGLVDGADLTLLLSAWGSCN
jgi:hypothetical protein